MTTRPSWPWTVRTETLGEEADGFIQRTIIGTDLGGGVEVAIVTTGSYTDEQEELHARTLAAAPMLRDLALGLAGTVRAMSDYLERTGHAEAAAIVRTRHDEALEQLAALALVTPEELEESRDRMRATVEAIDAPKH
jgi:hypothetical protein